MCQFCVWVWLCLWRGGRRWMEVCVGACTCEVTFCNYISHQEWWLGVTDAPPCTTLYNHLVQPPPTTCLSPCYCSALPKTDPRTELGNRVFLEVVPLKAKLLRHVADHYCQQQWKPLLAICTRGNYPNRRVRRPPMIFVRVDGYSWLFMHLARSTLRKFDRV